MCFTSPMPLPSGRRMSVRHRSKRNCSSRCRASSTLAALRVSRFMRPSVSSSTSRISGSSSTIRIWFLTAPISDGAEFKAIFRPGEGHAETGAYLAFAGMVFQGGAVAFAQLLGDIQAKPGALGGRGEERVEDEIHDVRR